MISMEEQVIDLVRRVEKLEKECRHFERQYEILLHQLSHNCALIQSHEWELFKKLGRPAKLPDTLRGG